MFPHKMGKMNPCEYLFVLNGLRFSGISEGLNMVKIHAINVRCVEGIEFGGI